METWQVILAIFIVGISIVMPIYYSHQKRKKEQFLEYQKIKEYGENLNQKTRDKQ